jgi:PhoPQ-activated pathogenicity-related protein
MNKVNFIILIVILLLGESFTGPSIFKKRPIIIWQPSHQTDTGKDYNEAATCNAIVEAAMKTKPKLKEFKVWSFGKEQFHHANAGSNTMKAHSSDVFDGKISGYAHELQKSNKRQPTVFISVHNNGGTNRNAVWGYIHEGDVYENENRELAKRLIAALASVTDLENRGVWLDSSTGRNDYRCQTTGKLGFYSLDENINSAPYRVLLEIGDNAVSRELLLSDEGRKKMGQAIKKELVAWMRDKEMMK